MSKRIISKEHIQEAATSGIDRLANIVGRTLGPGGMPILIERKGQALNGHPLKPKISKDGVSVANECMGMSPEEDVIVQTVKDICQKTNKDSGDGTTTAIVLGQAIYREAIKYSDDILTVKSSIDECGKSVLLDLESLAISVGDSKVIQQVAAVSANGDAEIGLAVSEAFAAVGSEGVVTIEEGTGQGVSLKVVEGYQFNRGAQSRQNFFNNKDLTAFEAENASVVIFDGDIRSHLDVIPLLMMQAQVDEATGQPGRAFPPTVLIANEFSRDVLQFLLIQKAERGLQICPVIGPNLTNIRTGYYDDLAAYTGGKRLGNGGLSLTEVSEDHIGHVKKVIINTYTTTLYEGLGSEEEVLTRVDHLKALRSSAESPYDAQVTGDRIASLTNGVAKIGVGGFTEVEILEKYDRVEDAVNAARCALQEGVVIGGGVSLVQVAYRIVPDTLGAQILKTALNAPFKQILRNIGKPEEEIETLRKKVIAKFPYGVYDSMVGEFVTDGRIRGIIDPVSVTKSALKNALSVVGLLLTVGGAVIYDD